MKIDLNLILQFQILNKIESGYLVTKEDNILVSSIINEMNSCYKD